MAGKKATPIVRDGRIVGYKGAGTGSTVSGTEGKIEGAAGDKFVAPEMKSGENALTPAYRARVRKARKEFNARKAGNANPTTQDAAEALRGGAGAY